MAKTARPRMSYPDGPLQRSSEQLSPQLWDVAKRAGVVALVGALLAAGIIGWPAVRFGLLGLGAGAIAAVLVLWHRPRWFLHHLNLAAAYAVAAFAATIALSEYHSGWGGRLGNVVVGWAAPLSVVTIAAGALLAPTIAFPRQMFRSFRWTVTGVAWTARALYSGASWSLHAARVAAAAYPQTPVHRLVVHSTLAASHRARRFWAWVRRQPQAAPQPAQTKQLAMQHQGANPAQQAVSSKASTNGTSPKQNVRNVNKGANGLGGWKLPPLGLLREEPQAWVSEEENLDKAQLIEQTLADYGIEVAVEEIRPGPVVTQFGVVPGWIRRVREVKDRDKDGRPKLDRTGKPVLVQVEEKLRVRVDTILSREKDLAMALAAKSLRFEAPVPGESFLGLEVPNHSPATVTLRGVMESASFKDLHKKGYLPFALGKGSGGEAVAADLTTMPHLLIAGATGSGKSVCINTIIGSLMMLATPFHLRFIMTDPKRVELTPFNGIPHLALPVVVEPDEMVPVLRGVIREMQERFRRLEAASVRNIQGFNAKTESLEQRMPYLVVVIDELADLMMAASVDVEHSLCRLAQLGRAVGIHLVVATQRPSVDVITGLIKANFPTRISFAVTSQVDSRTILDSVGAEKLLGRGDMLFSPIGAPKPKRVQGAYVSDEEIGQLVNFWKEQQGTPVPPITLIAEDEPEGEDELLEKAKALAVEHRSISASLLQRKLGIGYPRASRLLDRLEESGIVAPGSQGKSRQVILRDDEPLENEE